MAGNTTVALQVNPAALILCEAIAAVASEPAIMEVGGTFSVAINAGAFGIGRSSVASAGGIDPAFAMGEDADDASGAIGATRFYTKWERLPIAPTQYFRRVSAGAAGCGFIWTFPKGLFFNATASMVVANINAAVTVGGVSSMWWTINE